MSRAGCCVSGEIERGRRRAASIVGSHVINDPDHGDPGIRVAAATELPARPTRRARVQTAGADPHHRARVAQG